MAILDAPLSKEVIGALKGTLDFYKWKGLNVIRKWPGRRSTPRTEAEELASCRLVNANKLYTCTSTYMREVYTLISNKLDYTPRDYWMTHFFGNVPQARICPPLQDGTGLKVCPDFERERWTILTTWATEFPLFSSTFFVNTSAPGRLRFFFQDHIPAWGPVFKIVRGRKCFVGDGYVYDPDPCTFDDFFTLAPGQFSTQRIHGFPFGPGEQYGFFVMYSGFPERRKMSASPWFQMKWPGPHPGVGVHPRNPIRFLSGPTPDIVVPDFPNILNGDLDFSWCRAVPF